MLFSLDLSSALKEVRIQYQLLLVIPYLLAIWFIIACFIVKEDIIAFIVLSSVFFIFGKVIELIMNGIGENTKSKDKDDSYFMFNYFGLFGLGIFLGVEYSIIRIILVVAFIFIILLDKMYYLWLLHKYSDEGIWLSKKGKIGFITSILLFILKPIIYILFIIASSRHIFKFVHKVYKSINHNLQKDVTLFYVLIKLLVTAVMTIAYIGGIGKFFLLLYGISFLLSSYIIYLREFIATSIIAKSTKTSTKKNSTHAPISMNVSINYQATIKEN